MPKTLPLWCPTSSDRLRCDVVCAFVLHNYVNLNIGLKLALEQAVAYFVQWTIVGIIIGLIYKPLATP